MTTRSVNDNAMPTSSELNINIGREQLYDLRQFILYVKFLLDLCPLRARPNSPLQQALPPPNGAYTAAAEFSSRVFNMGASGAGMEIGGYGSVPVAYKEVICRQIEPVLQDGQIGVDQDTMMMYDAYYL
jgi:hypothetical protein